MKKLFIILSLIICLFDIQAQKYIQSKENSCKIRIDALSSVQTCARYTIQCFVFDIDTVVKRIPVIKLSDFRLINGSKAEVTGLINIPDMWPVRDTAKIYQSDIGRTWKNIENSFGAVLCYYMNVFKLDMAKWELREE